MDTIINHPVRKALRLSIHEYCVLDEIYALSHNEKYGGWCIASKKYIGETLDISERTVHTHIITLLQKKLIKKDPTTGYLRSTDEFNEMKANKKDWLIGFEGKESQFISGNIKSKSAIAAKFADGMKNLQTHPAEIADTTLQKLQGDPAEIADNTNKSHIIDSNIYSSINSGETNSPTPAQTMRDFILMINSKNEQYEKFVQGISYQKKIQIEIIQRELDKFVNYWTEKSKDGKRERWEMEKVFEVQRRLGTWFSRIESFQPTQTKKPIRIIS